MAIYTYKNLELNGRLGNQLWQIASTVGIADVNNGTARFRPDWEYRKFFSVPFGFFGDIPADAEVVDGGTEYLQELRYWEHIEHFVRSMFHPSRFSEEYLQENYGWFFDGKEKVAIHVRRGDYLKYPNHFLIPSLDYYHRALESIGGDHDVYVFSDDPRWCRRNFRGFNVVEGTVRPVEVKDRKGEPSDQWDLFLMANCQHHVISNSTFSWWGAWLSGHNDVRYPSKWFGPELSYIPWRRMLPPEWIEINAD